MKYCSFMNMFLSEDRELQLAHSFGVPKAVHAQSQFWGEPYFLCDMIANGNGVSHATNRERREGLWTGIQAQG